MSKVLSPRSDKLFMKLIKSVSLFYTEGSSDKVYHTQIQESGDGFTVTFQYGRRNSTLQTGSKTAEPVPLEKAQKIFDKLVAEKVSKGYTPETSGQVFSSEEFKAKKSEFVPQLLNPIEESDLETYLTSSDFVAQEKHDGERRIVVIESGKVQGVNRKGMLTPMSDVFNDQFDTDMVLDCEIIGDRLFSFDILAINGTDLTKESTLDRIKTLKKQNFGPLVTVSETATTTAAKKKLLKQIEAASGEGIVFKDKNSKYIPGRPSKGGTALKYKLYKTATFIVNGVTKNKRSVGLTVLDGKNEVEVGKVTIPPNFEIPEVNSLIEVRYLYAYRGGAVFQPVYLGVRTDMEQSDASIEQLVYKAE